MTRQIQTIPRWRSLRNVIRILQNPIPVFKGYLEKYGETFQVFIAGVTPAVFSIDPDFAQHVLQKNHRNYQKSSIQKDAIGTYVGKGLLTTDGPYWLKQRRLIQPGFHRERLNKITSIITVVIDNYLDLLEFRIKTNPVVNIYQETLEVAHRIIVRSIFSDNLNDQEMTQLGNNITEVQKFLVRQIRLPFLDFWFSISGQKTKYLSIARESDVIIRRYIKERRSGNKVHDDLLQMLLESKYEDTGRGMTDQQLLDESLILFIAGHETSANAMAWMTYLLSQHTEIAENLRSDQQTNYPKQVINEALRLYPPAWITDRVAIEEDVFNGINISKGMITVPYIYEIHHSERLWRNADEFDPERFSESESRHPFAFMPFGGGPRLCIGNNFAMMEMEMFLTKFTKRFDFRLIEGQEIEVQPMVTLRPKNGIMIKLIKRIST